MKNPFKNTDDYMIVREFNRLTTRKRSLSNSSEQSIKSRQQTKFFDYGSHTKSPLFKSRINSQYLFYNARTPVHAIQKKRAQVFGVQELRYKPAYFESLDKYIEKQSSKSNKQITDKSKSILTSKSQKSIKQIRFSQSPQLQKSSQRTQKSIKNKQATQKQISSQYNLPIIEQKKQRIQLKKRGSIIQQMIQLNVNGSCKLNQFYASNMDLKSKSDVFMSSLNLPFQRKQKRKVSLFYDEQEKFTPQILARKYQSYQQDESQNLSKMSSQYTQDQGQINRKQLGYSKCSNKTIDKSKRYSIKKIQRYDTIKQAPVVLKIRNKNYYLYEKNNRMH